MSGIKLRFVPIRGGRSAMLVIDNARLNKAGRGMVRRGKASRAGAATVPLFLLVPRTHLRKRLDIPGPAEKWASKLPALVVQAWQDVPAQ